MKAIYLSGKIGGLEREEYEKLFLQAQGIAFRDEGPDIRVINPVDVGDMLDRQKGTEQGKLSWEEYMKASVRALTECTHIYMLSNWLDSRGARVEHNLAKELGLTVVYIQDDMKHEIKRDLAYYKTNAEEDYRNVPISVLRYIGELEKELE